MNEIALTIRKARLVDLKHIIELLADDPLGSSRESTDPKDLHVYETAFNEIDKDPNHELLVADSQGKVFGVLQLSYLIHISRKGAWRAQIEGVRVSREARGHGIGRKLIEEAIKLARLKGCQLLQLTSDKTRTDAISFYESMGFVASHEGLKLKL